MDRRLTGVTLVQDQQWPHQPSLVGALSMQIVWKLLSCPAAAVVLQVDAFRILPQPKGIALSMQSSEVFPPKDTKPETPFLVSVSHNKF